MPGVELSTAIANTRMIIDEPTPQFWTDAQITEYINECCLEVARKAEWKRQIANLPVAVETQTIAAPTDMNRIYRLEFAPTASINTYTVEFRGYMEMDQVWGINQQWPANYPLYYTLWGYPTNQNIILYPVPSQAGIINCYYYQIASQVPATDPTGLIDMPFGYEDMSYDYAAYRCFRQDSNPMWKDQKQLYEDKLQTFIDMSRTYQDQAGTFSTGQAALPAWLTSEGY